MKSTDEIEPSEDTLMTDDLIRIFKSEGCSPTVCHACTKEIKTGEIFKLVPHPSRNGAGNTIEGFTDEMCCDKCGSQQLKLRDIRHRRNHKYYVSAKIARGGFGFSRPSKL